MRKGYDTMCRIIEYTTEYENKLIDFLDECLPESGRTLDIKGQHSYYREIETFFHKFWIMIDSERVIGTVAIKSITETACEIKSLYLLKVYHNQGLGHTLLTHAVDFARTVGYEKMYLDSLSTSTKAISLYRHMGFTDTEKYNNNLRADVFMERKL